MIILLASKVRKILIDDVKQAKYYSMIVDSIVSHTDQFSFILRYVEEIGNPVERFLLVLLHSQNKSEKLVTLVMIVLSQNS